MVLGEFLRNINDTAVAVADVKLAPSDLAQTVKMSEDGIVSKNAAKDIVKIMFEKGGKPQDIAKANGLIMENDSSALEEVIDRVIGENAESVQSFKDGNQKVFGFLMGQVIRYAGKGANPKMAKDLLMKKING